MAKAIEFTVELDMLTCGQCGIVFAAPINFVHKRVADHQTWWCPNGHPRAFTGASEAERLRKELARERAYADTLKAEVTFERDQRKAAEHSLRATKGQLTRTRKRIANGVCPCCKRTFQNLARHMAGQHPEYEKGLS